MTGCSVFLVACSLLLVVGATGESVSGTWRGTFRSQPQKLLADGTYPETVNRFELTLRETAAGISGEFKDLEAEPPVRHPIKNGGRFGERACFDIIDDGKDMRWCVSVRRGRLIGIWNRGPEGGPMVDGMGIGVRIFSIVADRAH